MERVACCVVALICLALLSGACTTMGGEWKRACELNTIQAYQDFIAEYPHSELLEDAEGRIATLQEIAHWNRAQSADSITAYEEHLRRYPTGQSAAHARSRLKELRAEQSAWGVASSKRTTGAYRDFLNRYPSGEYSAPVKALLLDELRSLEWQISFDEFSTLSGRRTTPYGAFADFVAEILRGAGYVAYRAPGPNRIRVVYREDLVQRLIDADYSRGDIPSMRITTGSVPNASVTLVFEHSDHGVLHRIQVARVPTATETGIPIEMIAYTMHALGLKEGPNYGESDVPYPLWWVREGVDYFNADTGARVEYSNQDTGVGMYEVAASPTAVHGAQNGEVRISFHLVALEGARVSVGVFAAGGDRVRTFSERDCRDGENHVVWDCRDDRGFVAGTGDYLCVVRARPHGPGAKKTCAVARITIGS